MKKRGRPRKYCIECGKELQQPHNDSEGYMFKHGYCSSSCMPSKKAIKKAPIKKDKPPYKKMHCATKEMTVYERLDLLEKMLRCIPKLRKEVADLRKQVYGK